MLKDLRTGKTGEYAVIDLLNDADIKASEITEHANRKFYDIVAVLIHQDDALLEFFVEVKKDVYAAKSGNIAIEVFNPKSAIPSGISVTKADIWAHIINDEVWITHVKTLKDFIANNNPLRIVTAGGDGNATLYLYTIESIIPEIFHRIDNISNKKRHRLITEVLTC